MILWFPGNRSWLWELKPEACVIHYTCSTWNRALNVYIKAFTKLHCRRVILQMKGSVNLKTEIFKAIQKLEIQSCLFSQIIPIYSCPMYFAISVLHACTLWPRMYGTSLMHLGLNSCRLHFQRGHWHIFRPKLAWCNILNVWIRICRSFLITLM